MKILVNELRTEIVQNISGDDFASVEAIRLHLYKHNNPIGSLRIEIRDEYGQTISGSNEVEISDLGESSFFHGQVRFDIKVLLRPNYKYQLVLKSEGYSFEEQAYVGWCLDFDFNTYPKDANHAHDYEIWCRK